ncbi:MAG: RNase adapter RapZ [Bacteroidales bacterium]|jgi:aminoglycoside/choline kinase family phosphotransferase|nr:RNase adapter RapZ [Bacteroidales bacterium]
MKKLHSLFKSYTGEKAHTVTELTSSGSNRRYFRMEGPSGTLIGTLGSCIDENKAFIAIADHFHKQGLAVPLVYAHSKDFSCYIQQDLGDITLYGAVEEGRARGTYNSTERALLHKAIEALPELQFKGARGLDFSVCYPQPNFDQRMVSFDLNYFKYCFLKATGLDFSEIKLENDFQNLSKVLLQNSSDTFLYRDFQARNVMLLDGIPYFIDFQGGRKGPIFYDVASFVWQARAHYSDELKDSLIQTYLQALQQYSSIEEEEFHNQLRHFVLFRTLQVLGAYGFRGYFEKKPHFLQSVPFAIDNLRKLLKEPFKEYPYLSSLLLELTNMRQYSDMDKERKLKVTVCSFAYKKGIPIDQSGNGGGYVFDCRGLENPGKFEHYRHFTGEDPQVIQFLEEAGEVNTFLDHAYALMDKHVQRYMERKFTHLMCCFGCTGGQHRSVYCARHMSEYLSKKYDINVHLYHRELDIETDL